VKKQYTEQERLQIERARAWLSRYRWLLADVEVLLDVLAARREMCDKIASSFCATMIAAGAESDRTADQAVSVCEAEEKLLAKKAAADFAIMEIVEAIDCIANDMHRAMLKCYFIRGLTWEQAADFMGYSHSPVFHAVNDALLAVRVPEDFVWPKEEGENYA